MSDVMLHGILNMPPDLWNDTEVNKMQRYDAYKEASRRIRDLNKALLFLESSSYGWQVYAPKDEIEHINKMLQQAE